MAALQLEILCAAAAAVAPGGRLVYATCALEAVDEATADAFEARHPELAPWPFATDQVGRATHDAQHPHPHRRTFWPHRLGTDGFFVARWKKKARAEVVSELSSVPTNMN
jgi:16S rRNA (cytosine967-C5)-methyltransferase